MITTAGPLVEAADLHAGYRTRAVLKNIRLQISEGELIGLCGPNGSGKTTLLHCLTGYHPLQSGTVKIGGKAPASLSRRQVAEHLAFVPQRSEPAFSFSALEIVLMGRHPFAGLALRDSEEDLALALAALTKLNVEKLAHRSYSELSGGEQQMVLLARAFAQNVPLLVLDEPLTGLDIRHQFQLMEALSREVKNQAHGALVTFHDLITAARWCTRLILLRDGRIVADGIPTDVLTAETMSVLYDVKATLLHGPDGRVQSLEVQELSG